MKYRKEKMSINDNKSDPNLLKSILIHNQKDENKEVNQNLNEKNESMLFLKNENIDNKINNTNINLNVKSNHLYFRGSINSFNFRFNPIKVKNFVKDKKSSISLIYNLNEVLIYIFCNNLSRGNL